VEEAGSAVHAPLPSLDLGAYSPEFRADAESDGSSEAPSSGETYFAPETSPVPSVPSRPAHSGSAARANSPVAPSTGTGSAPAPRCVGCGGISSAVHSCGAPLCQHCIGSFPKCPKCGQPISTDNTRGAEGMVVHSSSGRPTPSSGGGGIRGVFQRTKTTGPKPGAPAGPRRDHPPTTGRPGGDGKGITPSSGNLPPSRKDPGPTGSARTASPPAAADGKPLVAKVPEPPAPPAAPVVRPRRDKPDDEPRL
jgi:hypothetical protein